MRASARPRHRGHRAPSSCSAPPWARREPRSRQNQGRTTPPPGPPDPKITVG
jgi:hypothetical protein